MTAGPGLIQDEGRFPSRLIVDCNARGCVRAKRMLLSGMGSGLAGGGL